MTTIQLPDDIFNQIMTVVGYPFVTEQDLEINFDQIKEILLKPALREYFRWFPIETYTTLLISTDFDIPFPDQSVFSVKDMRMSTRRGNANITGNAMVDERVVQSSSYKYGRGMYGTRNTYGYETALIARRAEVQSNVDFNKAFKWRVLENQRKVVGFTNISGTAEITWASFSDSWDNVAFSQQGDVIKLCQSKILEYFGRLRQQSSVPDAPIELNGEILIERAKDLYEEVLTKWRMFTTPIIMRG